MKKIMVIILFLAILLTPIFSFADDIDTDINAEDINNDVLEAVSQSSNEPKVQSRAAIVFDRDSKQVLWGKQENVRVPMASTTNVISYQR